MHTLLQSGYIEVTSIYPDCNTQAMYEFERNRENKFAMKTVENKLAWVQQICNITNMYFVRVCNIELFASLPWSLKVKIKRQLTSTSTSTSTSIYILTFLHTYWSVLISS